MVVVLVLVLIVLMLVVLMLVTRAMVMVMVAVVIVPVHAGIVSRADRLWGSGHGVGLHVEDRLDRDHSVQVGRRTDPADPERRVIGPGESSRVCRREGTAYATRVVRDPRRPV